MLWQLRDIMSRAGNKTSKLVTGEGVEGVLVERDHQLANLISFSDSRSAHRLESSTYMHHIAPMVAEMPLVGVYSA
jgi:hypothetical protein